jgi:ribosomal protein L37AE/L43A
VNCPECQHPMTLESIDRTHAIWRCEHCGATRQPSQVDEHQQPQIDRGYIPGVGQGR